MKECPLCGACQDGEGFLCAEDGRLLAESFPGPAIIDGKYLLERRLGTGGMGTVYKAKHKDLQKTFALKLIRLHRIHSPDALARFRVEAQALGRLQHPNIVQVTDYGIDPRGAGVPYLVMEYLEGWTLRDFMEARGFVASEEALPIVESVAAAIDFAHDSGILHRDLKPHNIFLVGDPRGPQVKIVDFGLARIAGEQVRGEETAAFATPSKTQRPSGQTLPDQTQTVDEQGEKAGMGTAGRAVLTSTGTIMGTPGYIAPEILFGDAAASPADIYAFGVLLYEMLVGQRPFDPMRFEPGREVPMDRPPLPSVARPSIPQELDDVLLSPLETDPGCRPPRASEVARRLRQAIAAARYRCWRAREGPRRTKFAVAIALMVIPLFFIAGRMPAVRNVENSLASIRFRFLPLRSPDDRIVLLSIDEATLQAEPALLTERADEMGAKLQAVMDAGAIGLGIDFLLPERWNRSRIFAAFLLRNQDRLTLASYITKDGEVLGPELLRGLIMAALGDPDRAESLFGFVNIEPDGDGRIRRTSLGFKKKDAGWVYALSARAFQKLTGRNVGPDLLSKPLWVDYAIDWTRIPRLSWKDLSSTLEADPGYFRGRYVLVGGEYEGSQDFHSLPVRSVRGDEEASGMVIQALIVSSLLDSKPFREAPPWMVILFSAGVTLLFSSVLLMRPSALFPILTWLAVGAGYLLSCVLLFATERTILPAGLPLILWAAASVFVLVVRRRLRFIAKEGGSS